MGFVDGIRKRLGQEDESIDSMIHELGTYKQSVSIKQKNASRGVSVCKGERKRIQDEKAEAFRQVRRLADEDNHEQARSYLVTMHKLEKHEKLLQKEEEIYKQRVFEYSPLMRDIDLARKDLMYKKQLSYINKDVRDTNLQDVVDGFNKIRALMKDDDIMAEPIILGSYMMSKENMIDAQEEFGYMDVCGEDNEKIFEDIASNPDNYSSEILDAYGLISNHPDNKENQNLYDEKLY